MFFVFCVISFLLALSVGETESSGVYETPPHTFSDNTESNDINLFPNNNDISYNELNAEFRDDLWKKHPGRKINDIDFWLNWNNPGGTTKPPKQKPTKPSPPVKNTRTPSKPTASHSPNGVTLGKVGAVDLDENEPTFEFTTAKPSTTTSSSDRTPASNSVSTPRPTSTSSTTADPNVPAGGGGGGGGDGGGVAGGLGLGFGLLGKGVLDGLGAGTSALENGVQSPNNPPNPNKNQPNPPKEKPKKPNENDKNQKDKQKDKNKEEEDDDDIDLDDLFDEDDFINYDKFKVKSHSIDDIANMFADKFKRLEYASEWLANNLTNELNNLTVFKEKYQDMAVNAQKMRENYGNKIDGETDNDVYNQMLEGYNAGVSFEAFLDSLNGEIEIIQTMLTHFADAASIVENESFRIKTKIVEMLLEAQDFHHQIYKTIGAVRGLAGASKLRIVDCLSPYFTVYQLWRNSMKRLYLEGIRLERNTYRSLINEHYSMPSEWRKVQGKFEKFIERAKRELQGETSNVIAVREPIYNCAANVTIYMFYKTKRILKDLRSNLIYI